jgi:sugar-specific transcriptional regulator TrmB
MKDIKPILKSLGLLESEVNTYMAAFKNGASTVIELSKQTGLSRQATYSAIESLASRGLMASFLRGKKNLYTAEHPDRLLTYASRRQDEIHELVADLKRSLPELELQMAGERPKVRAFEGHEGVIAIFDDVARSKPKEIHEISDSEAFEKTISDEDLAFGRNQLIKSGTFVNGIYTEKAESYKIKGDRIFLSKKDTGFNADVLIYGNKTALISLKGKQHSVIVESKEIADAMRLLFKLALEKGQKQ